MVAEKGSGDLTIEFACDKISRFCGVLIAGDEPKMVLTTCGVYSLFNNYIIPQVIGISFWLDQCSTKSGDFVASKFYGRVQWRI